MLRLAFIVSACLLKSSLSLAQPSSAAEHLDRGRAQFRKGEFDQAIAQYDEAIKLDATNATAFVSRGCARAGKKLWSKAIEDFTEAIRLDPKNSWAWYNRGFAKLVLEPDEITLTPNRELIKDFTEAIRLDPANPLALFYRAHATTFSDPVQAFKDVNECIRLDPKNANAYRLRMAIRMMSDQRSKEKMDQDQLKDADAIILLAPDDAGARYQRGALHRELNDAKRAAEDFEAALRLNPKSMDALCARASLRCDLGEWIDSLNDFNEVLKLDPKNFHAIRGKAWILAACPDDKFRDGKAALQLAKAYLEMDEAQRIPGSGQALMAGVYAELGNFDEAVKWQKRMLENPVIKLGTANGWDGATKMLKLYEAKKPNRLEKGIITPGPVPFDHGNLIPR